MDEDETENFIRLKAHEDYLISSSLQPIYDALHASDFQKTVQTFASQRWEAFVALLPDGSHPLSWTLYHQEFKDLFDGQVDSTLIELRMTRKSFIGLVDHLDRVQKELGPDAEKLNNFIRTMMASEEYTNFLKMMFAEVQRQQAALSILTGSANTSAGYTNGGHAQTQEIEVVVPEGLLSGQMMPIVYKGVQYDLAVPDGFSSGMKFRTAVAAKSEPFASERRDGCASGGYVAA